ncbi:MAG: 23S rRNA (adenine(2503)-C(2))-methyltransferase RlmN [Clostridia bacterium]|nr:23S rRNA (adenine(2503)-C(2))-methyltransferase RlmN [Clostridia bacterium]
MKTDLRGLTYTEIENLLVDMGEAKFRAKQLYPAIFKVDSLDEVTTLSKDLRARLSENFYIGNLETESKQQSKDGTVKFLFKLHDGNFIESVFMKYHHGNTLCVSSQVGCLMGCKFCASTIGGKVRDLSSAEIMEQIIAAQRDTGERVSNIVMMGIGEPLDNFSNVMKFLEIVNHPDTLNIGLRHISLSTCGIVPKIYELAERNLPITLSVSLHAPFNDMRSNIMPVNKKYPLDTLVTAMYDYIKKTNRRISIEYALIQGKNDTPECANELVRLFKNGLFHINLIPVNNVRERDYKKTTSDATKDFCERLNKRGLNATVRRELGADIDAACGQLRRKKQENISK